MGGKANGQPLLTNQPLNMLSMIDTKSGEIKDQKHELFNKTLNKKILVFPNAIGSSVGAYIFYSLKTNKVNPLGIICLKKCDTITASGCAISDIPLVDSLDQEIKPFLKQDIDIFLDADNQKITLEKV